MSKKSDGQLRRSQVITTWGPGSLIDLPRDSGIVAGLETWPNTGDLVEIDEPRLCRKLALITQVPQPKLYAPPGDTHAPGEKTLGIGVYRFPEWNLVQAEAGDGERQGSRRLVHQSGLDDKRRFDNRRVVATRFVCACPKGHVNDVDWNSFVHRGDATCQIRKFWLDEHGTGGDLADLTVRCACKASRPLVEATKLEDAPLGVCRGERPWLGRNCREECKQPSRLLIRTASNAYFSQVLSVLSLPDRGSAVEAVVAEHWSLLQAVETPPELLAFKKLPQLTTALAAFGDDEVLAAIRKRKQGGTEERPVKLVELDALLAAPEGFGDDVPVDPNFHARRLPDRVWRQTTLFPGIAAVIQLHRLREVQALFGFTRFEAVTADVNGEYASDVTRADLAREPQWFPAVENRGEGIFVQLGAGAVASWLEREPVKERISRLDKAYQVWLAKRKSKHKPPFRGGPYVLLHTLSHLLLQSLAMRCGYPASSIRERIYTDTEGGRFGILLYTATPDAEGTLGGLVQQARHLETHLEHALRTAALCSNDPICAQHSPGKSLEDRLLHGAACHGCAFLAETSCEARNDYLDRALVVPTLGNPNSAFFETFV